MGSGLIRAPVARNSLVSDMLLVLATGRQTYLSLYEKKADRRRWVTDVTVQTSDPAAEE